ncbi:DUF397 domain-containing protein [Streptomyces sp. NPDC002643]
MHPCSGYRSPGYAGVSYRSRTGGRLVVSEPIRVWRKSSHSGADNGCVEMLTPPPLHRAPIRDSKLPRGPVIDFRDRSWVSFVQAMQQGELPRS